MRRALALLAVAGLLLPTASVAADAIRQGYWWYRPKADPAETPPDDAPPAPVIPPMAELSRWSPPRIAKLITEQRDYAATVLTVEAVSDFWRLEDFARRKARAFAGVTQLAMLAHPELSAKSANPMIGDARDALGAQGPAFVIEMSTAPGCLPCGNLWTKLHALKVRYGLTVRSLGRDEAMLRSGRLGLPWIGHPIAWLRPVSDESRTLPIAIGTDHAANLARNIYLGIKMQTGVRAAVGVRAMAKFTGIVAGGAGQRGEERR